MTQAMRRNVDKYRSIETNRMAPFLSYFSVQIESIIAELIRQDRQDSFPGNIFRMRVWTLVTRSEEPDKSLQACDVSQNLSFL